MNFRPFLTLALERREKIEPVFCVSISYGFVSSFCCCVFVLSCGPDVNLYEIMHNDLFMYFFLQSYVCTNYNIVSSDDIAINL